MIAYQQQAGEGDQGLLPEGIALENLAVGFLCLGVFAHCTQAFSEAQDWLIPGRQPIRDLLHQVPGAIPVAGAILGDG